MNEVEFFLHEAFDVDGETKQTERLGYLVHDQIQNHCMVYKIEDKERGVFFVAIVLNESELTDKNEENDE